MSLDFDLPDDLWERGKPFLEHVWDVMHPDWEPGKPPTTYRIWKAADGLPCKCSLCGADDKWFLENDDPKLQVFVCEHESSDVWEAIPMRMVDTVAAHLVGRFEVVSEFDG